MHFYAIFIIFLLSSINPAFAHKAIFVNASPQVSDSTSHLRTTPGWENPTIIPHAFDLPDEEAIEPALTEPQKQVPYTFSPPQAGQSQNRLPSSPQIRPRKNDRDNNSRGLNR